MTKTTLTLIVAGALFLGGVIWLGSKMTVHIRESRALAELKEENPVEYYVLHTPGAKDEVTLKNQMVGLWKLTGAKSLKTGEFVQLRSANLYFKSFTESNWATVNYDANSNVTDSASGPYVLKGDICTETIQKASGAKMKFIGASPSFHIRVVGDDYYQMGAGNNPSIEQQWHRVAE